MAVTSFIANPLAIIFSIYYSTMLSILQPYAEWRVTFLRCVQYIQRSSSIITILVLIFKLSPECKYFNIYFRHIFKSNSL